MGSTTCPSMPIKASNRLGMVSLSMYEMQMDMAPVVVSTRATNVLGAVMVSRLHLDMQDTVQKYSIAKALRNGSRDGALHGRQRIRSANIAPLLLHRLKVRLPAMPGPRCRGVAVEPARCLSRPLRASITDACAIGAARRIPVFDATNPRVWLKPINIIHAIFSRQNRLSWTFRMWSRNFLEFCSRLEAGSCITSERCPKLLLRNPVDLGLRVTI
jgi:hypothetical protein